MVEPLRHRQTKEAETRMPDLTPPRHIPTLPRADPWSGYQALDLIHSPYFTMRWRNLIARQPRPPNGEPSPDWKPGTDTIADIRPGSFLKRSYEERQKRPDDLEAQEGQRPIAIHALENLAHSDTGVVMLRRLLREQLQRVEQGLDPINTLRDPSANKRITTGAWNTILSPTEAASLPYSEDL